MGSFSRSSISMDDRELLKTTAQEFSHPQRQYWRMLNNVSLIFKRIVNIVDVGTRTNQLAALTGVTETLINMGEYYLFSKFFFCYSETLASNDCSPDNQKAIIRFLKYLLTSTWSAFQAHGDKPGKRFADLPVSPSPAVARLAQMMSSDSLLDHMRLQVFLFAEVMAHCGVLEELQWFVEQPCWARCRPTGVLAVLLAQTALLGVMADSRMLDMERIYNLSEMMEMFGSSSEESVREMTETARKAFRVWEIIQQSCFGNDQQPGDGPGQPVDDGFSLAVAMREMAAQEVEQGKTYASAWRYLDMCTLVCDGVWTRETHARFPLRFQEAVRVLLCIRQRGAETWGVLKNDDFDEVLGKLAFPLSDWL